MTLEQKLSGICLCWLVIIAQTFVTMISYVEVNVTVATIWVIGSVIADAIYIYATLKLFGGK